MTQIADTFKLGYFNCTPKNAFVSFCMKLQVELSTFMHFQKLYKILPQALKHVF